MQPCLRTFIALDIPESTVLTLQEPWRCLSQIESGVRWIPPSNWHITLKFLGDIPAAETANIIAALQPLSTVLGPLSLSLNGLGVFPNVRRPRIVWLGLQGDIHLLQALYQQVADALFTLNPGRYTPEDRPFTAHVTVGRVKNPQQVKKLPELLTRFASLSSPPFSVDHIILKQSTLTPRGAVYTDLARVVLS